MGFRDLKLFNRALIAKVAWRILNNPESLFAQTLRGIYFPNENLFEAPRCTNQSWAWIGIREGINSIKEGALWKVGNGRCISIWEDKWIPNLHEFQVSPAQPTNCPYLTVFSLIGEDQRSWDESKLERLFSTDEVNAILSIPIGGQSVKDSIIWQAARDVQYLVKSGYCFLQERRVLCSDPFVNDAATDNKFVWRSTWGLKAPNKIKSFMWKMCHNIVPTRGILARRFHGAFRASDECP
ncbi:hypothetical protein V6N13_061017 [Hibiscus sabdariffa]